MKVVPLVPVPAPVVTEIVPVVAAAGTATVMEVSLQVAPVAMVPLNFTVLVSCVAPKADPVMVTEVPIGPPVGLKPLTTGTVPTVKLFALVPVPAAVVTDTVPVVAPDGTGTVIDVSLQAVTPVARVVPNFTVLEPCGDPKLVPVMVTEVATGPPEGVKLATVGTPTVNGLALLPVPFGVVTLIRPEVAPLGTRAVI